MSQFEDQVVCITGAGRGIGRAIATAFASRGAIVAVNDLTPVNLDDTIAHIQSAGGRAKDYIADVAKKIAVQTMVANILDDWGQIDILINNAGVEPHAPILEMDEWDWRRTVDVNLNGPFFAIQSVGRVMRTHGGGVIVNLAANAGRAHGLKDRAAFVSSKMGLIGLTRAAANELAAYNIRVNAVCPGTIETDRVTAQHQDENASLEGWDDLPQRRSGMPEDVVALVLFLCSEAEFITGQAINVDGGQVMC